MKWHAVSCIVPSMKPMEGRKPLARARAATHPMQNNAQTPEAASLQTGCTLLLERNAKLRAWSARLCVVQEASAVTSVCSADIVVCACERRVKFEACVLWGAVLQGVCSRRGAARRVRCVCVWLCMLGESWAHARAESGISDQSGMQAVRGLC